MAISFTDLGTNSNEAGATVALTSVTVPAGSTIVIFVDEAAAGASPSISDGTNTYAIPTGASVLAFGGNTDSLRCYVAFNASLSSGTITYTKGTSGRPTSIIGVAVSGVLTATDPVDGAVTATNTGPNADPATLSITSGTPAVSGEAFLACAGGQMGGAITFTIDSGNGWATPPGGATSGTTNSSCQIGGGSLVNSGVGTKVWNPTWSSPGLSRVRAGILIGLKPKSGAKLLSLMGVGT